MKLLETSEGRHAFSLLELTASVAILAILGVLIAQVSGAIQMTTIASNRMVDAAAQARLAFDRIGLDLGSALRRYDADFYADNHDANEITPAANRGSADILRMLSQIKSQNLGTPSDNREISVVGYDVAPHPFNGDKPCLQRASRALLWSDKGFMGLNIDGYPPKLTAASFPFPLVPADYDILAPGVIRMVVGFQLSPYNDSAFLTDGTEIGTTPANTSAGQIVYSPPAWDFPPDPPDSTNLDSTYVDLMQTSSIVIAVVVLDLNSLKVLNPDQVTELAERFATPLTGATTAKTPLSSWMADTQNLSDLPSGMPIPARQAVRVYQRAFPTHPYGSGTL